MGEAKNGPDRRLVTTTPFYSTISLLRRHCLNDLQEYFERGGGNGISQVISFEHDVSQGLNG